MCWERKQVSNMEERLESEWDMGVMVAREYGGLWCGVMGEENMHMGVYDVIVGEE